MYRYETFPGLLKQLQYKLHFSQFLVYTFFTSGKGRGRAVEAEVTEIIDDVMLYSKDARTGAHRGAQEARAGTRGP
jgi:hypothetical protein